MGKIKDLLSISEGDPGRAATDIRPLFVDAVVSVLKTESPWCHLPKRYGNPNTVWKLSDRRCANGTWENIANAVFDADLDENPLDSRSVKAHPVSSTDDFAQVDTSGNTLFRVNNVSCQQPLGSPAAIPGCDLSTQ